MKKSTLFLIIILGLARFSNAQSIDPLLAAELQQTIDSMRNTYNVKGMSACVIYPGQGIWKGVSGESHSGVPITSDMEFGIASNTKLFTGVLLLKLAENNILQLDDSLHEFLPPYDNIDSNITIRQLLNHTSGLYDVTSVPGYPDSMLNDPNRIFTAAELMTWAEAPLFAPGTSWSYCNTNYLLAAMIAEHATGLSYDRLLRDSILSPLQLDSTFLDVYDSISVTTAHPWQAGNDNSSIPRKSVNSAAWSAGAMYSTAGEMAQWYQALMNGQVINAQSLHEMTTFVGSGQYGIGISRAIINGRTVWQHGGAIWGGYNSSMMYDTASGIIVCVLINQIQAQAFQVSIQLLSKLFGYTLGIPHDSAASSTTIYPNPSGSMVSIDIPQQEIQFIRVFDSKGELVKESMESRFSVADLCAGIYIVHVRTTRGNHSYKLIKE